MDRTQGDKPKLSRPEYREVAWYKYYSELLYKEDPEAIEALRRTRVLMKPELAIDTDLGIEICKHNNEESWGRKEILPGETLKTEGKGAQLSERNGG